MDRATIDAYDAGALAFASDWHAQPQPADLHAIVRRFFGKGLTADIGCGSGRDVAWLNANGYEAAGYDASPSMVAEARRCHPGCDFRIAALPPLETLAADTFDNVLCETVIMHLPADLVSAAVRRLVAIVKPGGTLCLSWRVSDADRRDGRGRLYSAIDAGLVRDVLRDTTLLIDEEVTSTSSGNVICRIVARK
jgi:SAM-dependent methyltransferase